MGGDDTGLGTSGIGLDGRSDQEEPLNDTSKFGGAATAENANDSFDAAFDKGEEIEDFMVKPKPRRA